MIRAAIFGAQGTLGQALTAELPGAGYQVVAALARNECSITDEVKVQQLLARLRPEVVFNAAAYTNVDRAEDEVDQAFAVNALGTFWGVVSGFADVAQTILIAAGPVLLAALIVGALLDFVLAAALLWTTRRRARAA